MLISYNEKQPPEVFCERDLPSNCLKINVLCCVKNLKFRTKIALFRSFGEQIEKDTAIFAMRALKGKFACRM